MEKKLSFVIAVLLAVFLIVGSAHDSHAALTAVSPTTDPVNGFPSFYQDGLGFQLQLCTDPVNCIVTDPVVGNAFSGTIGFGAEMFYFFAESDNMTVGPQVVGGSTDTPRFRMLVEAAFGSLDGNPENGTQIVFGRLNLSRIVGGGNCPAIPADCVLQPSATYTVTHPYGTFDFTADVNGEAISSLGGQAFRVEDGGAVNLDFTSVLPTTLTGIGPFLQAVAPAAPTGFIGNGLILQTVSGSPAGTNFVRITGPNIGGPGVDLIETSQFALAGQIAGLLARFGDVPPAHFAFTQIDAIATFGITGGCQVTPPLFCPDNPITRAQMAVFMETSLGNTAPAACTGTMFTDVTAAQVGVGFCNFIEAFANRGITGGCAADDPLVAGNQARFCPNDPVTRGQMGVFIETALGAAIPACSGGQFGDVPLGHPFCGFIEKLAADGITGGCTTVPRNFCPDTPVTRAQMAVFIVAAPTPLLPD